MKTSLKKLAYLLSFGAFVFTVNFAYANSNQDLNDAEAPADCNATNCPGTGKVCCKDNDKNATFYKG